MQMKMVVALPYNGDTIITRHLTARAGRLKSRLTNSTRIHILNIPLPSGNSLPTFNFNFHPFTLTIFKNYQLITLQILFELTIQQSNIQQPKIHKITISQLQPRQFILNSDISSNDNLYCRFIAIFQMGSQCVTQAKKPQKPTNKKTKQIQQSKINFVGTKSTVFSSLTCPIENTVIIDTAEKLEVFKEYQNQQVKWCPITFGSFTQKIYGTCQWVPGQPKTIHGKGSIYSSRTNSEFLVTGKFENGAIISKESYVKIFSNGTCYRGHLNSNLQGEGDGEIVYNQEERYKGSFVKGIPHGQGQFFGKNKHFKGTVSFGQKVKGIEKSPHGQYIGTFSENMRDGQGTLILNNGLKYEGKFSKNKRDGFGTLYTKSGKVQYSGQWRQDKKVK